MAFQYFDENSTLDGYHQELMQTIHQCRRTDVKDPSSDMMDRLVRLPRPILRLVMHTLFFLDRHGKVPQGIIATDPNYSSIFISNLGSIGLECGYHHLTNWGTNSCFVVIGKKHWTMTYDEAGAQDPHQVIPLGITLDRRIADGYYYSGTVALVKAAPSSGASGPSGQDSGGVRHSPVKENRKNRANSRTCSGGNLPGFCRKTGVQRPWGRWVSPSRLCRSVRSFEPTASGVWPFAPGLRCPWGRGSHHHSPPSARRHGPRTGTLRHNRRPALRPGSRRGKRRAPAFCQVCRYVPIGKGCSLLPGYRGVGGKDTGVNALGNAVGFCPGHSVGIVSAGLHILEGSGTLYLGLPGQTVQGGDHHAPGHALIGANRVLLRPRIRLWEMT